LLKAPPFLDTMRHCLASFLAACLTGGGWDEPDLTHFPSPLLVMVGFSGWLAMVAKNMVDTMALIYG
jgi:hypothetical protein